MWEAAHSVRAEVDPDAVWLRWADPACWAEDDHDVVSARMTGALPPGAVRATGVVVTKPDRETGFAVLRAERPGLIVFESRLPGAVMRLGHTVDPAGDGSALLTHRVRFTGPLSWFWGALAGAPIGRELPAVMGRLVEHAGGRVVSDRTPEPPRAEEPRRSGTALDLGALLDTAYEDASLAELLQAPADAIAGISAADAQRLRQAFGIRTIEDLGRDRFVRAAAVLVRLGGSGTR